MKTASSDSRYFQTAEKNGSGSYGAALKERPAIHYRERDMRRSRGESLDRFNVAEVKRKYLLAFYLNGFMAIITEWLEGDCEDSIEYISDLMERYAFGK